MERCMLFLHINYRKHFDVSAHVITEKLLHGSYYSTHPFHFPVDMMVQGLHTCLILVLTQYHICTGPCIRSLCLPGFTPILIVVGARSLSSLHTCSPGFGVQLSLYLLYSQGFTPWSHRAHHLPVVTAINYFDNRDHRQQSRFGKKHSCQGRAQCRPLHLGLYSGPHACKSHTWTTESSPSLCLNQSHLHTKNPRTKEIKWLT